MSSTVAEPLVDTLAEIGVRHEGSPRPAPPSCTPSSIRTRFGDAHAALGQIWKFGIAKVREAGAI